MQTNLIEKDVESKRLSATNVSLSVTASASPSFLSETSNVNSILSKSPTPSTLSNHSNNDTKLDDKKKLKKVFHKFLNKTKLFNGGHTHTQSLHGKKNSYSQSFNNENAPYENNIFGYLIQNNENDISNATANLSGNANTVSTSQPMLYSNNNNENTDHSNITNNYLTTPTNGTTSQVKPPMPVQLKEEKESFKSLPINYNIKDLEEKLQNETERNLCSENFTAKEFAAEVGITIFEEEEETNYYTKNSHLHHPTCNTCTGLQGTYCSSKSYGPRLDMSIFEPPTEKLSDSSKTLVSKTGIEKSSETLSSQQKIQLEAVFDNKNSSNGNIRVDEFEKPIEGEKNKIEERNMKDGSKINEQKLPTIPPRKYKGKKSSRFEVEILNSNEPKSDTQNKSIINTNISSSNITINSVNGSIRVNSSLNPTYSLPNLNDFNKHPRNGNGFNTTPSSPARRDYGIQLNTDNVYFNVGGNNNIQIKKPRRVSISKHSPINNLEDSKVNKLNIIIDSEEYNREQNNQPSSASSTSSTSPIHFEVNHPTSSSSSSLDIYNLSSNENIGRGMTASHDMTTTIITPDINDISTVDNDGNSTNTSNTITSSNTPSAEELKKIWIDKTLGGKSKHVNKYHITNFQTEISKADKTIHTTTTSKIKDCMTNTESVVFPIQIIKTPVSSKCNTCLKDQIGNTKINLKPSLEESTDISQLETEKEESEDSNVKDKETSEDGSNVVQVIQKGRFTVMKEHHDYKHAVPHHYKFVIIRNPSSNTLISQESSGDTSSGSISSSNSIIDSNKIDGMGIDQDSKETLSTIITPTSSSELTNEPMDALSPPLVVSPSDSPVTSRSPSPSTISIPHQQLANIAVASLSSNLNLSEGIAYTTTINTGCSKCKETNKNEEHVLIVPTKDEKQNNVTCIQSFTSSTTPKSSSLYISTSTINPLESPKTNELNKKSRSGLTTSPINENHVNSLSSSPTRDLSVDPPPDFSTTPKPLLFNKCLSCTSAYRSPSKANIENQIIHKEPKLEQSHTESIGNINVSKELSSISTFIDDNDYSDNDDNNEHSIIPMNDKSAYVPSVFCQSKPPLSPEIYPTLNSTYTLVNSSQNLNSQNAAALSEDLSVYTSYSDDTFIHNENDLNNIKPNSKLCEEINNNNNNNNNCVQFIKHSETELKRDDAKKNEFKSNLRKTQSVQYPNQMKPYNYLYDSLDQESPINVYEPLEIDEDNDLPLGKIYRPGNFEISQGKIDREVTTSPYFPKESVNKKKYFPTSSCDPVVHPASEYERKDSYYDYDQEEEEEEEEREEEEEEEEQEQGDYYLPNMERKYSEVSMDPSLRSQSVNGFERNRTYSLSSIDTSECSSKLINLGSTLSGKDSTDTTSTNTEIPVHPHHHHHFFVISNSEADIPATSQLKHNNDIMKENSNTRIVISSRQHRKFDITTSSISSKSSSIISKKPINNNSITSLLHHRRIPSNSSSHSSRFIITREPSITKNVNNNNKKSPLSSTSFTTKKPSRFTVTRQAIN